jgi:hypothetical protein
MKQQQPLEHDELQIGKKVVLPDGSEATAILIVKNNTDDRVKVRGLRTIGATTFQFTTDVVVWKRLLLWRDHWASILK